MGADPTTLVLDIGKSNAKLVLIDAGGEVLSSLRTANQPVADAAHGYTALGVDRLADWLQRGVPELLQGRVPGRISVTTHGAAFCALGDDGLVLPPIDYEWDGYGDVTAAFDASLSNFAHHGTPRLPLGLNAGRQIDYARKRWPELAAQVRCWLPYPQYWAWWFSGVACSEVSSLGCHTGLWAPEVHGFSDWAVSSGVAARFAPMRHAWDVIGTLRPALAAAWSLPEGVEVVAGVHDSNACLARHLRAHPDATVVSTGTWCVVMAPGANTARLAPDRDELVNVAVDGRPVATARFMGGRAFAEICAGADPAGATAEALSTVLAEGWVALPAAPADAAFAGQHGRVLRHGDAVVRGVAAVPEALRPALAALYSAQLAALLVSDLSSHRPVGVPAPVILEGPLALGEAFGLAMASALPGRELFRSVDELEGTARGAWMLARWDPTDAGAGASALARVAPPRRDLGLALQAHAGRWRAMLAEGTPGA
jgi:sugar (pentulose or hexulose) kinase